MNAAATSELIDIVAVGNTLDEGVLWDVRGQRVWWTDSQERWLFRYQPDVRALEHFELPERLGEIGVARRTVRFGRPQLVRECGDNCLVLLARDGKHGSVTKPCRHLESVPIPNTRVPRHLIPRPFKPWRYRQPITGSGILLVIEQPVGAVGRADECWGLAKIGADRWPWQWVGSEQ